MKNIPLEDQFSDVIGKAQRGLGLSDEALAARAGVSPEVLRAVTSGRFDEALVREFAAVLHLDADALVALGMNDWRPRNPGVVPGLACFNTRYGDMTVNSYLVWDINSDNAVCFDTGADASEMVQFAADREMRIQMVLLTHTHPDHIADLERLLAVTDARAFSSKWEALDGTDTFEPGRNFRVGSLIISSRLVRGHSRGGTVYVVQGLPRRIAVVGDALFAGSMGGGAVSYELALNDNAEQILTLPDDTILCPGHGPLTTVGQEKSHNPFFPEGRAPCEALARAA